MSNTLRTIKYLLATNPIEKVNYSGYYDATREEQEAAIYFLEKVVTEAGPRRVTILVVPTREDLIRISSGRSYKDQYWLQHLRSLETANSNVDVIDMADDLPGNYQNLFLSCDNHWSALGNLEAARIIAARYRSSLRRSPTASSH